VKGWVNFTSLAVYHRTKPWSYGRLESGRQEKHQHYINTCRHTSDGLNYESESQKSTKRRRVCESSECVPIAICRILCTHDVGYIRRWLPYDSICIHGTIRTPPYE